MIDLQCVTTMPLYDTNSILTCTDDFQALNHHILLKYAIFGPIRAQKREFRPKFSINQMMIDLKCVTTMSYYDMNSILPYIDDFSALNHRFLLKYAILGPFGAQKRGFGPKFNIGQMLIDLDHKYVII